MSVDTAAEQPKLLYGKTTRRGFLAGVLSVGAAAIAVVAGLTEAGNQPTDEQKQAEKFLEKRSLKSFVVTDKGSGDFRSARGLAIRNTSSINDPKTPLGIIDRLSEGTQVKGDIWRTDYNPNGPGQEREWVAVKYERGSQEIVGFATTRYLEEVKSQTGYSR